MRTLPVRITALLAIVALLATPAVAQADKDAEPGLHLADSLPVDPLMAAVFTVEDPAKALEDLMAAVRGMVPDEDFGDDDPLAEIDEELGVSLKSDILAHLGPEFGISIDLPPPDAIMGMVMGGNEEGVAQALGGFVVLTRVKDAARLESAVRTILEKSDAVLEDRGGLYKVTTPSPAAEDGDAAAAAPPTPGVYWGIRDGTMAMAASEATVRSALERQTDGGRIVDGADYAKVFAHLSDKPNSMSYLNLPKLKSMVESSQMLQGILASDPENQAVYDTLMQWLDLGMGVGSTTHKLGDGTLQMIYGPDWISSPMTSTGILAAIAVPNFLNAVDTGKQKRTMADMRSIGTAVEMWHVDNGSYPGPTDGWVSATWLTEHLQPVYIRSLPVLDGWEHETMYWSDGESYMIVSPGKDGVMEGDWLTELEPLGPTADHASDYVFRDGEFVQWYEGEED